MRSVVGLSSYMGARRVITPGRGTGRSSAILTFHDRAALAAWSVGERRAVISTTDIGTFATLYQGQCWAFRGVVRQASGILLWDCVSHADIGRFANMTDALAAATDEAGAPCQPPPASNVVSIQRSLVRCA